MPDAMDEALMRRGSVLEPSSACDWSGAKSASLTLSPEKGSCWSGGFESRVNSRGAMVG